jgi:hypothetical protein
MLGLQAYAFWFRERNNRLFPRSDSLRIVATFALQAPGLSFEPNT